MKRERINYTERNNTERIDYTGFYPRATEGARAYTKRKAKRTNIIIATIAIALAAVVGSGIFFFSSGALNANVKSSDNPTTAVTKLIDTKTAANTDETAAKQTSTQAPAAAQANTAVDTQQNNSYVQTVDTSSQTADTSVSSQTSASSSQTPAKSSDNSDSNIRIINGQRVYIDANHPAPANTGTPLHCSATGKTSYGFDWTYDTDNGNITVACNYNFDTLQYDFIIYGAAEGTAHVTLYYNTSDGVQAPLPVTVNVDKDLNATQG